MKYKAINFQVVKTLFQIINLGQDNNFSRNNKLRKYPGKSKYIL